MAKQKLPRLPRGLHWGAKSPYILFNWRDALGKQHHQSTGTTDPQEALLFKLKFLADREEKLEETEAEAAEDLGKLPLSKVSEMYFGWKTAKSSVATIERERRIFKPVLRWLGAAKIVKTIKLVHLRQYQRQRRKDTVKSKLQSRARRHGRSMEEEVREILRVAVHEEEVRSSGLGTGIASLFSKHGLETDILELRGHRIKPEKFGI